MKVIAAVLCLVAAANAAALVPVESTEVKSDRVGDSFSYSIQQQTHSYSPLVGGLSHVYPYGVGSLKQVVPASTSFVGPVEVKTVPVDKQVLPVEVKATEVKHIVPAATYVGHKIKGVEPLSLSIPQVKNVEFNSYVHPVVTPVKNVEVQSIVQPFVTPVKGVELKSYVHPSYVATTPVKSYVHPSSIVAPLAYTDETVVPISYGSHYIPYGYPYGYTYPVIKSEKVY